MPLFPLAFAKYQALGNDFVLVDARADPSLAEDAALARSLLDRHFGAGGDDLIFVLPSDIADVRMRIRAPSGAWLAMCGNGIRCLARYVRDEGISETNPLRVETDAGVRDVVWLGDEAIIEVDLLAPILRADAIPTTLALPEQAVMDLPLDLGNLGIVRVSCVSVGNPHAVFFVEDLDSVQMDLIGPAIGHHPAFREGVNVHAAQVLAPDRAQIRTWERGAGLTLA
jgi:diaminopimelate epimerase